MLLWHSMSVHLSYDSLLRNSDMPCGATALTAQVSPLSSFRSPLSAPFPCPVPSSVFRSSNPSVFHAFSIPIHTLLTSSSCSNSGCIPFFEQTIMATCNDFTTTFLMLPLDFGHGRHQPPSQPTSL